MAEDQVRFGRKKGFVVLFRSAAQDDRLSLEARGLFALMVSLPENWSFTVVGLARKAGCGKNKIRRILEELETVGYLLREQEHREGGQFGANIFVLQDEAPPLSQNLDNGEADTPTVVPKHRQRQNRQPDLGQQLPQG
ncbi:MAG: helix-turn-helix domain-containing protein, partial [Clostridia bacterium]|nr:helix-turn-helix domain-containing protein [Clostridia bacterium]